MEQKAILAGVNLNGNPNFEASMRELESLAAACGIGTAAVLTQNLEKVNISHYIGTGKVEELAVSLRATGAQAVIFNDELSPSQIRNLDTELECTVLDRTMLILDIFASRARTTEAKLQVEVAQLQYMLPRLTGMKRSLEQQSGGVGTTNRGAGEKALELGRRQIQDRIARLQRELEALAAKRQTQRRQRKKNEMPVVSLVGYTNAGKSTLLNALLELSGGPDEKKVLEKDMLFATLETSARRIELPDRKSFLLVDTVGFIDKLPHHLIRAFRSTLEEVAESDLLVHVVDASNPEYAAQIAVTNETLEQLGAGQIPVVYAFNKSDRMDIRPVGAGMESVCISARHGEGIDELLRVVGGHIFADYLRCEMLIPYDRPDAVAYFTRAARILKTAYEPGGTRLTLECRKSDAEKYAEFVLTAPV